MSAIIAMVGIVYSIFYVLTHHATSFTGFMDKPAIVLLAIMPPSIMLLSHTLLDFATGFSTLFRALFLTQTNIQKEVIETLTRSSALIRSEGIGALVNVRNRIKYELLRDGVSLILNDFSVDEIRHNLTNKINAKQSKMSLAVNLFENMSKLSPGVGMLGTLMGLVLMMSNMKDPSAIGGGMALAMITTLYGLVLGNIVYGPWSEKISIEAEKTFEVDMMVMEGLVSLKSKKSSMHMKDIMSTFGNQKTLQTKGVLKVK